MKSRMLDKLQEFLTPRQAVMVWLQRTNSYANVTDYIKSFFGEPRNLRPITLLTDGISSATQQGLKGQPEKEVNAAVCKAERDVVFLIKLHHQVNFYFLNEERVWFAAFAALEAKLRAITYGNALRQVVKEIVVERHEDVGWKMIAEAYLTQMYAFPQS